MSITIGIILDIVIVALLVVFGIIGFKKGFLKSILSIFSWAVCIAVAIFTAKYVAGWINNIYNFSGWFGNKIANSLVKSNEFFAQSINVFEAGGKDALINAIPSDVNGLLTQLIKVVFSNQQIDMTSSDSIASVVGVSLGHICMIIVTGVLIFIILKIAVALLSKLFKNIEQTKILGGLNKVLGLILGLIKASLIIIIINVAMVTCSLVPIVNKAVKPIVQEHTYVEKYIYNATDKLFEKYVIEGDLVKNWIEDLWKKR